MSFDDRQQYQQLYKTWNPTGFDAGQWMNLLHESGMKVFAFTSKHHEGFSMFDTKTRVRQRTNWTAAGGPQIESCDLAYSIMETPFRRDVVKELCDAAHRTEATRLFPTIQSRELLHDTSLVLRESQRAIKGRI